MLTAHPDLAYGELMFEQRKYVGHDRVEVDQGSLAARRARSHQPCGLLTAGRAHCQPPGAGLGRRPVASSTQRVHARRDCGKIAFEIPNSDVVFWRVPSELTSRQARLLLGKQRAKEIFCSLPELESFVRIQDQRLHECLGLLTTRFPNGFDG